MHRPGIEPGPPAWQPSILPLNHRYFHTIIARRPSKKKFPDENLLLIETVFYLGREYIKFNEDYSIITRFRGAIVARLTPDQEVACSNHVEINSRGCGR